MSTESGVHWRQTNVETAAFYTSKEVDHLIKETEVCYMSLTWPAYLAFYS